MAKTTRISRALALALGITALVAVGAASQEPQAKSEKPEKKQVEKVALKDLPQAVRAAIDKEMTGAKIKRIEKEEEDGKVVYDVEAKLKGKGVEMDIADDGTVLTREEDVSYTSLPALVRAAAGKHFGGPGKCKAAKEVENDKVFYEVEGKKDGRKTALKISVDGQQVEEEKN